MEVLNCALQASGMRHSGLSSHRFLCLSSSLTPGAFASSVCSSWILVDLRQDLLDPRNRKVWARPRVLSSCTNGVASFSSYFCLGTGCIGRGGWQVEEPYECSLLHSLFCARALNPTTGGWMPQNQDLQPVLPKRKKKPFLTPRKRTGYNKVQKKEPQERVLLPPDNGLLVQELIPVAHEVLKARTTLIDGVTKLMKVIPVKACRFCLEVHVGPVGHQLATCTGSNSNTRRDRHDWTNGNIDDVLVYVDTYHLPDRLGTIRHEERFEVERIPAVVELCVQAGVDLPEYPTKRRTRPVWMIGRRILEFDSMTQLEEDEGEGSDEDVAEGKDNKIQEDHDMSLRAGEAKDFVDLAERTLQAWDTMRNGARKLMVRYPVRVCGYCPEVHVGPRGHKVKLCAAYKHQWRAGQHGWQEASIDDLIPPKYVWHVREQNGPPLVNKLRKYYGQTAAVVELCVQAGAAVPDIYKPMMRLDVVIPDVEESQKVV